MLVNVDPPVNVRTDRRVQSETTLAIVEFRTPITRSSWRHGAPTKRRYTKLCVGAFYCQREASAYSDLTQANFNQFLVAAVVYDLSVLLAFRV